MGTGARSWHLSLSASCLHLRTWRMTPHRRVAPEHCGSSVGEDIGRMVLERELRDRSGRDGSKERGNLPFIG
jgi:hypothetical protein